MRHCSKLVCLYTATDICLQVVNLFNRDIIFKLRKLWCFWAPSLKLESTHSHQTQEISCIQAERSKKLVIASFNLITNAAESSFHSNYSVMSWNAPLALTFEPRNWLLAFWSTRLLFCALKRFQGFPQAYWPWSTSLSYSDRRGFVKKEQILLYARSLVLAGLLIIEPISKESLLWTWKWLSCLNICIVNSLISLESSVLT